MVSGGFVVFVRYFGLRARFAQLASWFMKRVLFVGGPVIRNC